MTMTTAPTARRLNLTRMDVIGLAAVLLLLFAFALLPWVSAAGSVPPVAGGFSLSAIQVLNTDDATRGELNLFILLNSYPRSVDRARLRDLLPEGAETLALADLYTLLRDGTLSIADLFRSLPDDAPADLDALIAREPVPGVPLSLLAVIGLAAAALPLILWGAVQPAAHSDRRTVAQWAALGCGMGALLAWGLYFFGSTVTGGTGLLVGLLALLLLIISRITWNKRAVAVITVLLALLWLLPLVFTVLMSVRPDNVALNSGNIFFACANDAGSSENAPSGLVIAGCTLTGDNYARALSVAPWGRLYLNSVVFAAGTLVVQLVTVTMAGYAFARIRFPGRNLLLFVILLQIMIPAGVLIVQNFRLVRELGVFDTYIALMMPYWGSAFGVLLLRQTFREVPIELEEAARIDGATWTQVMRHVYVPLSIPAYLSFALVSISSHWNEFLWPFMVTRSNDVRPLTIGLNILYQQTDSGVSYSVLMAGTILVIAPLVLLFMLFQKRFIESFASSGLK